LQLRIPSELISGRYSLYVCNECGDIGCGAITAKITKEKDAIIWSDFGYENTLDEVDYLNNDKRQDFYFDYAQYIDNLNKILSM